MCMCVCVLSPYPTQTESEACVADPRYTSIQMHPCETLAASAMGSATRIASQQLTGQGDSIPTLGRTQIAVHVAGLQTVSLIQSRQRVLGCSVADVDAGGEARQRAQHRHQLLPWQVQQLRVVHDKGAGRCVVKARSRHHGEAFAGGHQGRAYERVWGLRVGAAASLMSHE
eukprot:362745-Chlamydomonas_euryale.AAC.3